MKLGKIWDRISIVKLLVFASVFAGLYLIYISTLNMYLDTPVSKKEIRMTEGVVGFCFLMIAIVLALFNKKIKDLNLDKN